MAHSLKTLPGPSKVKLSPVVVEVIGSALASIVDEMGETLVRSSFSTNIKERRDCSTALFDSRGETLCQASHVPLHLGSFLAFVPLVLKRYPERSIRPGDVFIGNDAYEGGGTHLPDIVLAEPIFVGERIVAWAINCAHHADFVDRGSAHIYQEGLRIPPIKLHTGGEVQQGVLDLILLNCQVPDERLPDLRAQMAANRLGVERMQELCARYGTETIEAAGAELQDYAERRIRAGITKIPDGTYTFADRFDRSNFGQVLDFKLAAVVHGSEITLKFTSPPQVREGINVVYTALQAAVYYAIKTLVDPTVPPNSGLGRPIHIEAQKGTVLNCSHPAPVNWRLAACQNVVDLIYGAMAKVIPEAVTAASNASCGVAFSGRSRDGRIWAYTETIGGGSGARATKDGLDGIHVNMTNTSNLPVEALEGEYPLTVLRYELVEDSGGPGRQRGGMSLRRVYRAGQTLRGTVGGGRIRTAPWGLAGGKAGASGRFSVSRGELPLVSSAEFEEGDVIEIVSPGAGGFGDPRERDRSQLRKDVREGRVSLEQAVAAYGATPTLLDTCASEAD